MFCESCPGSTTAGWSIEAIAQDAIGLATFHRMLNMSKAVVRHCKFLLHNMNIVNCLTLSGSANILNVEFNEVLTLHGNCFQLKF